MMHEVYAGSGAASSGQAAALGVGALRGDGVQLVDAPPARGATAVMGPFEAKHGGRSASARRNPSSSPSPPRFPGTLRQRTAQTSSVTGAAPPLKDAPPARGANSSSLRPTARVSMSANGAPPPPLLAPSRFRPRGGDGRSELTNAGKVQPSPSPRGDGSGPPCPRTRQEPAKMAEPAPSNPQEPAKMAGLKPSGGRKPAKMAEIGCPRRPARPARSLPDPARERRRKPQSTRAGRSMNAHAYAQDSAVAVHAHRVVGPRRRRAGTAGGGRKSK